MLHRMITYTDYNGLVRTEEFCFNLTKSELTEMQIEHEGGFKEYLESIINAKNGREIMIAFKQFIAKSYGEKSPDGRRFIKSPELSKAFMETEAYNKLFMELVTDAAAGADFINGILPDVEDTPASPAPASLLSGVSNA